MSRISLFVACIIVSIIYLHRPAQSAELDYLKSVCGSCHGVDGISKNSLTPHLAGQKAGYIEKQLRDFRASAGRPNREREDLTDIGGRRTHPVMTTMGSQLTDEQIEDLARYYADLPCHLSAAPAAAPPESSVRRCLTCHETDIAEAQPYVPYLEGQNKLYLINQIYALQIASRGTLPSSIETRSHPVMEDQVKNLAGIDVEILAAYFSSRRCR